MIMRKKPNIKKTFRNGHLSFFIEVVSISVFVFLLAVTLSYKIINSDKAIVPYIKVNGENININNNNCELLSDCYNLEIRRGDKILFEKLPYSINNSGNYNDFAFSEGNWAYTVSEKDTEFRLSAKKIIYNFKVVTND